MPYLTPGADVTAIIDAPPRPAVQLAPGGNYAALVSYEPHPPVAQLARPYQALAGLRVDPAIAGRRRTLRLTGITLLSLPGGEQRPVPLPAGAAVSVPVWAPDGRRFACTVDEPDGISVWVADARDGAAASVPGVRVRDVLGGDPSSAGTTVRWSRDGRSLLLLAAPDPAPPLPQAPPEPRIEQAEGKHSQMATYADLLRTPADEDLFEALATTVPVRADPATGVVARLGPPGLYTSVQESPDGRWLLLHRLQRPFSFRVPYHYFARRVEVRAAAGEAAAPAGQTAGPDGAARAAGGAAEPAAVIADLPVSDEVPRHGVPVGPRMVSWSEREPAVLIWTEALDGGDPMARAAHRDQIMRLAAPFGAAPQACFGVAERCAGWLDTAQAGLLLLLEFDRDRRWQTTWLCEPAAPERNRVLFDLSADDAYGDPGAPMMARNPDGTRTMLQDGTFAYLRGDGATPDGDRPFLDRLDLATGQAQRLLRSPADAHEQVIGFVAGRRDEVLAWRESPSQPPNLWLVPLADPAAARPLTSWPDPHPQLTGMTKRLMTHDRGDGVPLSGILHLPPGHDPQRDGRLPLVIWAYPLDYGSAATAGQVRGSTTRFTRLTALDPVWFVLRGYAVLADATMPVIGDPETMNDTYIDQVTAAAAAHIRALDELGIIDPVRVAVGGHSYGAFMTANLLAHTRLFAAGIARSGAYNRSLTPFGFQTERRSFWEAPQVYDQVSPFRFADKITAPILLVHGEADANSGTFPIQSQRLFQAVQGTGGTARLVLLPHESHGYMARESVLHLLAEQFGWVQRWLPPDGAGPAPAAVSSRTAGPPTDS